MHSLLNVEHAVVNGEKINKYYLINMKCSRKLANIFMHERRQRIVYKDGNNIEFL